MPQYQDLTIESHTPNKNIEVRMTRGTGDNDLIKITRSGYRVTIDYWQNQKTVIDARITSTDSDPYSKCAATVKPLINNTTVLPNDVQRTALRLLTLGHYLDEQNTDKYQLPRSYGINPLRPDRQRYLVIDTGGLAGRHTGVVIYGFDKPVPSPAKIEDRVKSKVASVWKRNRLNSVKRHQYQIGFDDDLRQYVELGDIRSTESIGEARRIRESMRDWDSTNRDDDDDVGAPVTNAEAAEQSALNSF